jgi:hypothetical protein
VGQYQYKILVAPKQPFTNDGTWSMTGAHFDETVASKPPVDPSLPAAAMEQADRKSLRPESLHSCQRSLRRQCQQYDSVEVN